MIDRTLTRTDWNNNFDGTYFCRYDKDLNRVPLCEQGEIDSKIPDFPKLQEIYYHVYNWAFDNYFNGSSAKKAIADAEKHFGELPENVKRYLASCAFEAGDRAALLVEEPDHYD